MRNLILEKITSELARSEYSTPRELYHVSLKQWLELLALEADELVEYMSYPNGLEDLVSGRVWSEVEKLKVMSFITLSLDDEDYQKLTETMQELTPSWTKDEIERGAKECDARAVMSKLATPATAAVLKAIFEHIAPNYFC